MRRPQFTLRALLVAMLVVAAFFAGMSLQHKLDTPQYWGSKLYEGVEGITDYMVMPDGRTWERTIPPWIPSEESPRYRRPKDSPAEEGVDGGSP